MDVASTPDGIHSVSSPTIFPLDCLGVVLRFVTSRSIIGAVLGVSDRVRSYLELTDPFCCENVMFRIADWEPGCRPGFGHTLFVDHAERVQTDGPDTGSELVKPISTRKLRHAPYVTKLELVIRRMSEDSELCRGLTDDSFGSDTMPNLEDLDIFGTEMCSGLTDAVLRFFPKLRKFSLAGMTSFKSPGFVHVSHSLRALKLDDSQMCGSIGINASVLKFLPQLRELSIECIRGFSENSPEDDASWSTLAKLEKLRIFHTSLFDGKTMLPEIGSTLTKLDLLMCENLELDGLSHLVVIDELNIDRCPKLLKREDVLRRLPKEPTTFSMKFRAPTPLMGVIPRFRKKKRRRPLKSDGL